MSREVKCSNCGVKQDYAQMNKCSTCKKYYCDTCTKWSNADEYHGDSVKYYLYCPVSNSSLGTDWKFVKDSDLQNQAIQIETR